MSRCRYIGDLKEEEAPESFLAFPETEPITDDDENPQETNNVNPDPESVVPTAPIAVTQDGGFRNEPTQQSQNKVVTTNSKPARYNLRQRN